MRTRPPSLRLIVVATALAVGPWGPAADGATQRRSVGPVVAHHAGGSPVDAERLPSIRTVEIGHGAIEPTLGLTLDGDIFYAAAAFESGPVPTQVDILHSSNNGRSWDIASPRVLGFNQHAITVDPYVYVDDSEGVNRVYNIDLTAACSYLSFSDDLGESWATNPLACGTPVNDHQTLFAGPPVSSLTIGYPNVVYYCFNNVATSSCTKSLDGGLTFAQTGMPPYASCGGLHGHGVVGSDGIVYLPREYCATPSLAISKDEGRTWSQVDVSGGRLGASSQDPSVAVDVKGNLYYAWVANDRLPYLVTSRDGGKSWTAPMMVGAPGVKEANLVTIDVGSPGRVALAYMGSTDSPGPPWDFSKYQSVTWNGYITESVSVLSKRPRFYTGMANPSKQPLHRGACGPRRCGMVFDFIDIAVAPDGSAWAAFVDTCVGQCDGSASAPSDADVGLAAQLFGGPYLN